MQYLQDLSSLHLVGTLFILFAWSRVFLRYRDNSMSFIGVSFWSLLWLSILVVLYLPETTEKLAHRLGIGRGIDVAVYASIVVLFYLVYRIYVKIDSLEQELTQAVREESLKDLPKKAK